MQISTDARCKSPTIYIHHTSKNHWEERRFASARSKDYGIAGSSAVLSSKQRGISCLGEAGKCLHRTTPNDTKAASEADGVTTWIGEDMSSCGMGGS